MGPSSSGTRPEVTDLALGIRQIDNAFDTGSEIIAWLNDQEFEPSTIDLGRVDPIRTSKTVFVPFCSFKNPDVVQDLNRIVWNVFNEYGVEWQQPFFDVEFASVQRYEPGEQYLPHADYGPGSNRVMSAVAYLNTVDEGGETYFPAFEVKVKPVAGRIVVFPSNYIYRHAALPPERGMKYAVAYWANG